MTTTPVRGNMRNPAEGEAASEGRDRHALLRDWIESLGPAAVVTLLTHDDYEREVLLARLVSPPLLMAPGR